MPRRGFSRLYLSFGLRHQLLCFFTSAVRPASIGLGFMVQSLGADDHRLAKMAQQVKDVLPHVPLNVISKDLGETQRRSSLPALSRPFFLSLPH